MAIQVQTQFYAGAVLALLLVLIPGQDRMLSFTLLASAVGATVLALVVGRIGRVHRCAMHLILAGGSVIVTIAALAAANPVTSSAFTFCYAVMVVVAIACSSWRGVIAQVALALVAMVAQYVMHGTGDPTPVVIVGYVLVLVAVFSGRILRATVDSEIDVMTRLVNRRGFERRVLEAVTARAAASPPGRADDAGAVSIILGDLDRFEAVNRTQGREVGDAILVSVAETISDEGPDGVVVARLEGDQFGVLLTGTNAVAATEIAERLRGALSPVELSWGVAQLQPEQDCGDLLRRAETALHAAKDAGRNCVRLADVHDEGLLRALRSAIAVGSVRVALQPIVRPGDGQLVGVEALARWHHPARGWVPPEVFVALAEKNGLIPDLGQAVLERACRDASQLANALGHPLMLSVNASGGQLVRPEFLQSVIDVLRRTGWPPEDLLVEVTESSLDAASRAALDTLEGLRELGVRVAIDDFGTGYSAFSQLDTIPADFLKLDSGFTAAIATSGRRRAMLRALVALCADLDITVIAEGVETAEQGELVEGYGCALAQGYYYSRPMVVSELIATQVGDATPTARSVPASRPPLHAAPQELSGS